MPTTALTVPKTSLTSWRSSSGVFSLQGGERGGSRRENQGGCRVEGVSGVRVYESGGKGGSGVGATSLVSERVTAAESARAHADLHADLPSRAPPLRNSRRLQSGIDKRAPLIQPSTVSARWSERGSGAGGTRSSDAYERFKTHRPSRCVVRTLHPRPRPRRAPRCQQETQNGFSVFGSRGAGRGVT